MKDTHLAVQEEPSVSLMLQSALQQGITKDNADALGKLMELYERMEDRRAEQAYNKAFVALKQELPAIVACKPVPNNDGTVRYSFAPLDEIDRKLKPIALKHGFTYSWEEADCADEKRVNKVCVIRHIGGHSTRTPYKVRVGSGPPKSSECQADGAAHSYANRRALCDAFGIVAEPDTDGSDDARNEGHPITAEEAEQLRAWVASTGAHEGKFLEFAGAKAFEEISSTRLADLHEVLRKREQRK